MRYEYRGGCGTIETCIPAGQPIMTGHVFVSYAREDQDFVLKLVASLRDKRVPVWFDQWDIQPGQDWDQAIDHALHASAKVLIVLSPAMLASKQVRGELQLALDEGKPVVPVLYQACQIPRPLRTTQYVDFTARGSDDPVALGRVLDALGGTTPPLDPDELNNTLQRNGDPSFRIWLTGWISTALSWLSSFRRLGAVLLAVLLIAGFWYLRSPNHQPDDDGAALRGHLQVNVNVAAATVSVDGAEIGAVRREAPLFLSDLRVGQRRVRVQADGYEPQERRVNILANEWLQEGFVLSRNTP